MRSLMDDLRLIAAKAYMSKERAAAYEAAMKALSTPGCLVRVTFTSMNQIMETCAPLEHALKCAMVFDEERTRAHTKRGKTVFELTNGSGIEFAFDVAKCKENLKKENL